MSYNTTMQNTDFDPHDIMKMLSDMLADGVDVQYTQHALQRIVERDFDLDTIEHILQNGTCKPIRAMGQNKCWKYEIYDTIDAQMAMVITIVPDERYGIKIVTVYWNT